MTETLVSEHHCASGATRRIPQLVAEAPDELERQDDDQEPDEDPDDLEDDDAYGESA